MTDNELLTLIYSSLTYIATLLDMIMHVGAFFFVMYVLYLFDTIFGFMPKNFFKIIFLKKSK